MLITSLKHPRNEQFDRLIKFKINYKFKMYNMNKCYRWYTRIQLYVAYQFLTFYFVILIVKQNIIEAKQVIRCERLKKILQ